ncbi:MAG: hypothetical protein LBE70_03995 [Nitrososphaerota archaeon]|jgi:pyruvate/2-oxoglutarate dehydrogenase complex dihydrolipoamide acyltransferase (E2) component|nr:hypothetical protein [Nitrososphaerota archaeon]
MIEGAEIKIRREISAEVTVLEESYKQIKSLLLVGEYDATAVVSAIKAFKDSLSRASAYVLTLFTLKGKQVNISWEHLFTHLDYALTVSVSPPLKHRDTVRTVLSLSEAEFNQVLTYFATLKASIK